MQINVNDQVEELLCLFENTEELPEEQVGPYLEGQGKTAVTRAAFGGYLCDLVEAASGAGVPFDLTLEAVRYLPQVLQSLYHMHTGVNRYSDNAVLLGKAITCFATCLCAVSEEAEIHFTYRLSPVMSSEAVNAVLDHTIGGSSASVGKAKEIDFFLPGQTCVKDLPKPNGVLAVDFRPLIDAYRMATGKDLKEYGLTIAAILQP